MKPADKAPGGGGRKGARPKKQSGGKCPICSKPTAYATRPFCSKRCADIDLNRWLNGGYLVPGQPASIDDIEEGNA